MFLKTVETQVCFGPLFQMEWIFFLSTTAAILALLYYFLTRNHNYWKEQNIPSPPGVIPILGHMWSVLSLRESYPTLCERLYKSFPDSSMVGFFSIRTPTLLIRDPKLIKEILVSKFSSFHDNEITLHASLDPSMSATPFFAKGSVWKENRAIMTNGFSSKKLKLLFSLAQEVSMKLNKYLEKKTRETNLVELDLLHFWTKYTGEFVANVGFGVEGHCFEDANVTFQTVVEPMFDFTTLGREREMIIFFLPRLAKVLGIPRVPKKIEKFFNELLRDVIKNREASEKIHNDYLQMMIDYQKSRGNEDLDKKSLLVVMESFFLETYESASIALSFTCFQLACHQDVQERLREEVNSVFTRKDDGKFEFEALNDLTYMEQVINETLRIQPAVPTLLKRCTKDCYLRGYDGLSCRVKLGNLAAVSIYGLHTDEKYWPKPEKFDPERFCEEQVASRPEFTFLPFGGGPRICVGRKMAMIELKVALVQILKNYTLKLSKRTVLPLKRDTSFSTYPEGGLWVNFERLKCVTNHGG